MQHERIGISTKLGNDEWYLFRHQAGDEGDIAEQAVKLGNTAALR